MIATVCACTKIRRSARTLTALYDAALAPSGITTPQFSLLRMLKRGGPCTLSAFAERTGHDRTTLSRTAGALETAGLVAIKAGEDRRARMIILTEAGEDAIDRALPHWASAEHKIDSLLGPDRARLFTLLDRIENLTL